MSSKKRSETMNAYFDGYIHRKISLQTFVEQFEIALGDKLKKEIKMKFAMEVQFQ